MSEKVNCVGWGTEIRAITAKKHDGKCVPCSRGRPAVTTVRKPSKFRELYWGAKLTIGGAAVAGIGIANMFMGFMGDSWAFRYLYSPLLALLGLLFLAGGVAMVVAVLKKS